MKKLSVVIPTYNSSRKLRSCLDSIKWANEIIVVDMLSSDNTREIAMTFEAKIFKRVPKDGNFDTNRKFGMQKAKGDWILKLDSDEFLTLALQEEIINLLRNDSLEINGYYFYNRIFMLGRQIKHGFVKKGSHELRLFRNGKWRYNPFKFHQQITVDGITGYFKNYYDHFNVETVNEFIPKMNLYTNLDAKCFKNKVLVSSVFFAPFKSFFKLFCLQSGFLDGLTGFEVSYLYSLYNLVEKVKVWERSNL